MATEVPHMFVRVRASRAGNGGGGKNGLIQCVASVSKHVYEWRWAGGVRRGSAPGATDRFCFGVRPFKIALLACNIIVLQPASEIFFTKEFRYSNVSVLSKPIRVFAVTGILQF